MPRKLTGKPIFMKFVYHQSDSTSNTSTKFHQNQTHTRGQRPNELQKAVIIDTIKSVGEIASNIWPVV